jgi:preprotein translocase subunit SecF
MEIIKHRKIYFTVSALLVAASVIVIFAFGFNLGIDFTGGALMEIQLDERVEVSASDIEQILTTTEEPEDPEQESKPALLESVKIQPTGDRGYILRFKDVTQDEHQAIFNALNVEFLKQLPEESTTPIEDLSPEEGSIVALDEQGNPVDIQIEQTDGVIAESQVITIGGEQVIQEMRFESIGPVIGEELKDKAIRAIIAVLVAIILYIAWAFRKVSEPVSSWKYGVTAIIALAHDVIIPTGIFVVLGQILGIELDILFVTALLTILGFSVNDTIVVFDRTRENLARDHHQHDFEFIVNKSVNETIRRSIITSVTTFVVLLAIYLFGGESIKYFVLALMVGVVVGTYSSIFLASPLLVVWEHFSRRKLN